jgi:hypothetical protein
VGANHTSGGVAKSSGTSNGAATGLEGTERTGTDGISGETTGGTGDPGLDGISDGTVSGDKDGEVIDGTEEALLLWRSRRMSA